jgi:hypothetical protein
LGLSLLWANPICAKLKPAIQEATERYIVKDYPTHYNTATAEKETSWQSYKGSLATPLYYVICFGFVFIMGHYGFEGLAKIPTWIYVVIAVLSITAGERSKNTNLLTHKTFKAKI